MIRKTQHAIAAPSNCPVATEKDPSLRTISTFCLSGIPFPEMYLLLTNSPFLTLQQSIPAQKITDWGSNTRRDDLEAREAVHERAATSQLPHAPT